MRILFGLFFMLFFQPVFSQELFQTIRGRVVDKENSDGLPGAVLSLDSSSAWISSTDANGYFRMKDVPVRRHRLFVKMLGYTSQSLVISLNPAKETILSIEMEPSIREGAEIVIKADADKSKALNEMAAVSARSFTIDETRRYAGSLNDPSRMAANFAGVGTNSDARNDIIIRGNSPLGLLWRLNGIDIPNPNHFGSMGSTGGPVSILNNNTLDNCDFLSGAFPPEYGNAASGVFDLRLRRGNDEKLEGLGQVGFNGFELGLEGPFSKALPKASWLVNYRYSTLGFFKLLGINFGTGASVPQYQDITMHVYLPFKKSGSLSFFAIAGKSYIELLESLKDTNTIDLYTREGQDIYYGSHTYVGGAVLSLKAGSHSSVRIHGALSGFGNPIKSYRFDKKAGTRELSYANRSDQQNAHVNAYILSRVNRRLTVKSGMIAQYMSFILADSTLRKGKYYRLRDLQGNMLLAQAYSQLKYSLTSNLWLTGGVHAQYLWLNNTYSVLPRAGMKWMPHTNWQLGIGYGLMSQSQPMFLYFNQTPVSGGGYVNFNRDLLFNRSRQWVLSADYHVNEYTRMKMELYHQYHTQIPVELRQSQFSALNLGADFGSPANDSLVSRGEGRNYGIELTAERFIQKGFYYLGTLSLYRSQYLPSDGKWYSTAFDGNYIVNALAGKEFILRGNFTFWTDFRLCFSGGKKFTPIDEQASSARQERVFITAQNFAKQYPMYARADLKFGLRKNSRRISQEWIIDIQNVSNRRNVFMQDFSFRSNSIVTQFQMGILVIPQYRVYF